LKGGKTLKNSIEFRLWGKYALFTDPLTKIGGEKFSYHIPTYEALKGVAKSIYWKPTITWVIDRVRVMNRIKTQTKGTKPIDYGGGNSLAIYTFLADAEYQVQAHFEWNVHRPELAHDRIEGKHYGIVKRMLQRGGRQDIFLGTRDCQGYVEPCEFGRGEGHYDDLSELGFGLMFHGFDYPDETGKNEFHSRFWAAKMVNGVVFFCRPEECKVRRFVREMQPKEFEQGRNFSNTEPEGALI
jgi:CRISPR-associated protein Cas5d